MGLEIALGIMMLLFILGMAGGTPLLAFVIYPRLHERALNKRFPTKVPGWGTRLSSPPPFNATLSDIERGLQLFLDKAVGVKGYDKKTLKKKLDGLRISFIRAHNEDGGRYIVDRYGRKIAGDHSGDFIRLVVLDDDDLRKIAFFHELGHEAHEMENIVDYNHEDNVMWRDIVKWCKNNF